MNGGLSMKVSSKEEFDKLNVFGLGDANTGFAEYFIGVRKKNSLSVFLLYFCLEEIVELY